MGRMGKGFAIKGTEKKIIGEQLWSPRLKTDCRASNGEVTN